MELNCVTDDNIEGSFELPLGGLWESGEERNYSQMVHVPGIAGDPGKMNDGTLWYRISLKLPQGNWKNAVLVLKGARFCPSVYINGVKRSEKAGGMTQTVHPISCGDVRPGNEVILEIALKSLKEVSLQDASRIPEADIWRTNISSCLWDKVILHFYRDVRISRVIPFICMKDDSTDIYWELESAVQMASGYVLKIYLIDSKGSIAASGRVDNPDVKGRMRLELKNACKAWSPEDPACYKLKLVLSGQENEVYDIYEMSFGLKDFRIKDLGFLLNDRPVKLRAGTVVWHRWVRDPESHKLAFDEEWFERNVVLRLKGHGANTLRFHLGMPPEAFLDLCDRHGLMVQAEWSFFHGMTASRDSLVEQWRVWLDLCMRHPSICLIHPWNETEGDELERAFSAISELEKEYPPMVVSHRDVEHIHKYWWSLFENICLNYDSASQFEKPIMVDEFGGNYLDGDCNPGHYPAVAESLLRFLGPDHTKESRLILNTLSNTRIAEYWRRIGAAGFSPFCILGSPEDGSHHFLGRLEEGEPKPVWEGMTAAYSPISASLDVWDGNYLPGQRVRLPLSLFNDTGYDTDMEVSVNIVADGDPNEIMNEVIVNKKLYAFSCEKTEAEIKLPSIENKWKFQAVLKSPPAGILHPVISSWPYRTTLPKASRRLKEITVAVPEGEAELVQLFYDYNIRTCNVDNTEANLLVISRATLDVLAVDEDLLRLTGNSIDRGCSVLMLGIGPMDLGQQYPGRNDIKSLYSCENDITSYSRDIELFHGLKLHFNSVQEPESCIHPTDSGKPLWHNMENEATWLWNGLRGGLIVPACDMDVTGLEQEAFIALWESRGANPDSIKHGSCYAYELAGFYAFSEYDIEEMKNQLREKVRILAEDAPSLQIRVSQYTYVKVHDLAALYRESVGAKAVRLAPLAVCGKNLTRTPVIEVGFGEGKGKLILSQLITSGRLSKGFGGDGFYGIRYDPAAVQIVLNMLDRLV